MSIALIPSLIFR